MSFIFFLNFFEGGICILPQMLLCTSYYVYQFKDLGIKEFWIKYGTGDSTRCIQTHKLADIMGSSVCKFVLKAHVLSGCDVTSKVGTKTAALENTHENYLRNFGETSEVTR